MKRIPLDKGKFTLVDDEDFVKLNRHNWFTMKSPRTYYVATVIPSKKTKSKQLTLKMHRFLMNFPKSGIDHIDGDGLNNQRLNLRLATNAQNQWNSGLRIDNTSGHKGVCWNKNAKKWKAQIRCKSKYQILLGYFKTKEEAAKAYDNKAKEFHGEFARTNFKQEVGESCD